MVSCSLGHLCSFIDTDFKIVLTDLDRTALSCVCSHVGPDEHTSNILWCAAGKDKPPRRSLIVVSSPGLMAALAQRIQRNYVEEYTSIVYRQGSSIEGSFDAHLLEFVAPSFVGAESFE